MNRIPLARPWMGEEEAAAARDVILSGAKVYAEIGEILAGSKPRPAPGTTVIFKALGQAVCDAVAAKLVFEKAR